MSYKPEKKCYYDKSYFKFRNSNDKLRLKQFKLDKVFINNFISKGNLCDVGCSTGEFAATLNWQGKVFGMETSLFAKKKAKKVLSFKRNIFNSKNYFDLIIFRGTIHHIDEPFRFIKQSRTALKKGGYICFLATPNTDSLLYKIKGNLPLFDFDKNFYMPGFKDLTNSLNNFGFKIEGFEFPYLYSPYSNFFLDHLGFILNIFLPGFFIKHSFWKSSMNIMAKKK